MTNDGTLYVISAGKKYKITSSFTFPGGKNGFPSPRACDPKWKVVKTAIAGDAVRLNAAGSRYSIRRDFFPGPMCLEIRDTITNITKEKQPIIIRHHVPMQADADEVYLGGLKGLADEFYTSPAWMKENPTGYAGSTGKTGLGFAAYDDVFRVHAEYFVSNRSLELSDKQLVLAPGKTITMIWQIYPVEQGGYMTFINNIRQRHHKGVNAGLHAEDCHRCKYQHYYQRGEEYRQDLHIDGICRRYVSKYADHFTAAANHRAG